MISSIIEFPGLSCTINTTEDCNLRCKYCYEICKAPRVIDFETCKKFINTILEDPDRSWRFTNKIDLTHDEYIFDFIGGDSLMDVDLLDKIFRYIITKVNAYLPDCSARFSISTNGTLFLKPKVRKFCEKWKDLLSISVSIDGCPAIHDLNRIYSNGRGSMEDILKSWDWYKKTFPLESLSTKATCNRESIPYLYESLVFMHEKLGLKYINQNFIMEDMHLRPEDLVVLNEQLEKCVNYVAEHQDTLFWSMIDYDMVYKRDRDDMDDSRCGSGTMPACGIDGNIYPCFRWLPHTQQGGKGVMCVGNVDEGLTHKENFIKVQQGSIRKNCTKDPRCLTCEYEPACAYCIGGCYAEFGEFIRTTHICEVTKLICKWADYYWDNLYKGDEYGSKN